MRFELKERDFSLVTEAGGLIVAPGKYSVSIGGGQPGTGASTVTGSFEINGRQDTSRVGQVRVDCYNTNRSALVFQACQFGVLSATASTAEKAAFGLPSRSNNNG